MRWEEFVRSAGKSREAITGQRKQKTIVFRRHLRPNKQTRGPFFNIRPSALSHVGVIWDIKAPPLFFAAYAK